MDGQVPVHHEEGGRKESSSANGSVGSRIYKHLMNGVSHMLPFVIGGGILTALAFLIDTLCGFGATGGSNFGSMTPLSAFFKYAGGLAMGVMVPVLAGFIAESIADRPGLAVGFLGGILASSGNAALSGYVSILGHHNNCLLPVKYVSCICVFRVCVFSCFRGISECICLHSVLITFL